MGSPPDLAHAIQAVRKALPLLAAEGTWDETARVAVEAAAPVLLQVTRDRLAELEHAIDWQTSCTACARMLDASIHDHERAEQAEDRLADLEVYAAELHDFIRSVEWYGTRCNVDITGCEDEDVCPVCDASEDEGHRPDCRLAHALQVDPPARGRAILDQVVRLRERARQEPCEGCYERCCGASDVCGCHTFWTALDLGAAQEEDSGG